MSERAKNVIPAPIGEPAPTIPACANGQSYTVKSGDTMFFIAKRFNVSLQNLIDANPQIADPNLIFPGQVLCIPTPVPGAFCPNGQIYRVVSGDTIYEIAQSFGISMDALLAANPQIADPNLIFPGQEICIPMAAAPMAPPPAPACPMGTLYTVQAGDTLFDIARANNILLDSLIGANPQISDPNLIFPGQVICIPEAAPPMMPLPEPAPQPLPAPLPVPRPMPCGPGVCPMPAPFPSQCPTGGCPMPAPAPMPFRPAPVPMPAPFPSQCPIGGCPMPAPAPIPFMPAPVPMPFMPAPVPMPAPMPMPAPAPRRKRPPAPLPPVVAPIREQPLPQPVLPVPPCQLPPAPLPYAGVEMAPMPMMYQPMPAYYAVPWQECPFRAKRRKHHRRRCR